MAYVFMSKLPEDLALHISAQNSTKHIHKQKLSKCFEKIHDIAKYNLIIDDPNGEIYKFNALTIWGVIDLLASFTLIIDGKFSISLNFPKLLENMYLVIADKNAENREVSSDYCFEYIEANLHLIGGLHNLDNFASNVSSEMRDVIHEFKFCKKGIKNIEDIGISLKVWKNFIASSTY